MPRVRGSCLTGLQKGCVMTRKPVLVFWLVAAVFVAGSVLRAEPPQTSEPERIERLAGACRLWGAVKYFHPYLAYREDIDWDAALVAVIPMINAARNAQEYAAAVQTMLDPLGDPVTRVLTKLPEAQVPQDVKGRQPVFAVTKDGILVITVNRYADFWDFDGAQQKMDAAAKEIPKAKAVIFDFRATVPPSEEEQESLIYVFKKSEIATLMTSTELRTPAERRRMHEGFASQVQDFDTSDTYFSAFYTTDGQRIEPARGAKDVPAVFLVNADSKVPSEALAFQAAGKGAIVAEGSANGAPALTTQKIQLADGVEAVIRLGELVYEDGSGGLIPDIVVPISPGPGEQNQAFLAAMTLAKDFHPARAIRKPLPARAVPPTEKSYSEMTYPALEYRVLGAFRIWTVIHYFFPYAELMGEDWDSVLKEFIPRMEKAGNALEYNLAVSEMMTHIHDSHGFLWSSVLVGYFGAAPAPVMARIVEGVPVITEIADEKIVRGRGVAIGDVVLSVDGEDANQRLARFARILPASTSQSLMYKAVGFLLRGPENSEVRLTLRDRNDRVKNAKLPCKQEFCDSFEHGGEILKLLPGNIGYADLGRLTVPEVDGMFEKFKDTKAIIFDMRGYPNDTAWAIAPRLTEKNRVAAAVFRCPVLLSPGGPSGDYTTQSLFQTFTQFLPRTDKWRYKGKTVMLIDEETLSQAEHTGLFFEAANGTTFIGSPTAGANGDVTSFRVPGGIGIMFTGEAVQHIDGRQLQRVGLVPHIEVRPTIKGIREGRDEVLERAVSYLKNGK